MRESQDLRALTADPVDEARLNRNWRAIDRRRRSPRTSRRAIAVGAVGLVAAAAALVAFVVGRDASPAPLALASGAPFNALEGRVTELDDGSRITRFDGAEAEVLEASGQRVVLRLVRGRVRFEVTPGGPRRWIVEAGAARVEVVGTVFSVDRGDDGVAVDVERGVVLVRADELPDGVRRLTAGERVRVAAPTLTASAGALEPPGPRGSAVARVEGATAEVGSASASADVEPAPDDLAELEAEAESPPPSTAREAPAAPASGPTARQLMDRADAARAEGDHARAARALRELLASHPEDESARMAAVTLGRLELRQLGQPARAARTFGRALRMGLTRTFDEDVRAQRVEALSRAGDAGAAREAASEYHRRYPDGRWTSEVERWAP